jgi:hypothetical protein
MFNVRPDLRLNADGAIAAAGERRTDGPRASNLLFDPSTPRTVTPARCPCRRDDGSYRLVTEGEGLGLLQSKHAPEKVRDIINRQTWEGYQKEILDRRSHARRGIDVYGL